VAGYWRFGAWDVGCRDTQSGLVELQVSESVLGSWLSRDAWGGPVGLQISESVWAASCLEMWHGLPLLLLVMGQWSVVLCHDLGRIPLVCWLCPVVPSMSVVLSC
jgi:diadenosine tetraphosphatase ApaH/serine/threonine PP2A family protein phosphatase